MWQKHKVLGRWFLGVMKDTENKASMSTQDKKCLSQTPSWHQASKRYFFQGDFVIFSMEKDPKVRTNCITLKNEVEVLGGEYEPLNTCNDGYWEPMVLRCALRSLLKFSQLCSTVWRHERDKQSPMICLYNISDILYTKESESENKAMGTKL